MSKDKPLVSIIISTYKRSSFINTAVNNALEQSYENIEIVVVDDNNPDTKERFETEKAMREYSGNERIKYIKHEKNSGAGEARNTGLRNCNGEYIAFLDDDDLCTRDRIEKQVSVFRRNQYSQLGLVYCYSKVKASNKFSKDFINERHYKGNCIYEFMYDGCIAATSQWLCKKDILLELGGFKKMPSKEESDLMFRLLLSGYEIDFYPEPLVIYGNQLGEHLSTMTKKQIEAEKIMLDECRHEYHRLSFNQIANVEIEYAKRLYWLYEYNHMKNEMKETESFLYKYATLSFFKDKVLKKMRDVKHRVLG